MCEVLLWVGCPRVIGDGEDSDDGDDFEDEFQLKSHQETRDQSHVDNPSVIQSNIIYM